MEGPGRESHQVECEDVLWALDGHVLPPHATMEDVKGILAPVQQATFTLARHYQGCSRKSLVEPRLDDSGYGFWLPWRRTRSE